MSVSISSSQEQIEQIADRADRNCHAHIAHALRLKAAEDFARFVATCGGITVLTGSAVTIGRSGSNAAIEIAVAVAGAVITLVSVWEAVWQPGARSRSHKQWAEEYAAIENECRLALYEGAPVGLENLLRSLLETGRGADLIPERHWKAARQRKPANGSHSSNNDV